VNIEGNDFVENILQNKFYACCYILLSDAHLSAGLLCYFSCHWCRNLAAVNYIVHWIILSAPRCRWALDS